MNTRIRLHPSLDPGWNNKMQRQINLSLSTLHQEIANFDAELQADPDQVMNESAYSCKLKAKLRNGKWQSVVTRGSDPHVCITDAAERMRRYVIRETRHAAWVGSVHKSGRVASVFDKQ